VREKFSVELEREVRIIGGTSPKEAAHG